MKKIIYSCVVDAHPKFAYQAWHLSNSLIRSCAAAPDEIHVHFTPEVPQGVIELFSAEGYRGHRLERFGDGRWCNKVGQIDNLIGCECDWAVLLDTDMIAVADVSPLLVSGSSIRAKVVDLANPSLEALEEIFRNAGVVLPQPVMTDGSQDLTLATNANGGFYAIPSEHLAQFSAEWKRWVLWLLQNDKVLEREHKTMHTDQVGAALALASSGLPFSPAPSNLNYYMHFSGDHRYFDPSSPIALLHYHDAALNVLGLVEPPDPLQWAYESEAVEKANALISSRFNNQIFWNYRYACFPERGSGIGSRGENLSYKRMLLLEQGVEQAEDILDVGCGDLEVVKALTLSSYLGLDVSAEAIDKARLVKPSWRFRLHDGGAIDPADFVMCFEVLIHQSLRSDYLDLIDFLAEHTRRVLIVSGYDHRDPAHMVFFHEPLQVSLIRTGRFSRVEKVGEHTDVSIYRCEV